MNKICLIGRATRDAELRFSQNGVGILNFTLAVDRRDKDKNVDFIDCVVLGKGAEALAQYVIKGKMLGAEGRLQIRQYEVKDGSKRRAAEVIVDKVTFCDSKPKSNTNGNSSTPNYDSIDLDDEIPF